MTEYWVRISNSVGVLRKFKLYSTTEEEAFRVATSIVASDYRNWKLETVEHCLYVVEN